jgi:predicted protein tyrosine phosphatase
VKRFKWGPEIAMLACDHFVPERHAHICIRTPGEPPKMPPCKEHSLHQAFNDLDPEAIKRTEAFEKDPQKGRLLIENCFTEDHAREIREFLKIIRDEHLVFVNCEAGVSRSAGVVLALRRHYGGDEEEIFQKAAPNIHVTSIMTRILKEQE